MCSDKEPNRMVLVSLGATVSGLLVTELCTQNRDLVWLACDWPVVSHGFELVLCL